MERTEKPYPSLSKLVDLWERAAIAALSGAGYSCDGRSEHLEAYTAITVRTAGRCADQFLEEWKKRWE